MTNRPTPAAMISIDRLAESEHQGGEPQDEEDDHGGGADV
jgi:hypothetical protein